MTLLYHTVQCVDVIAGKTGDFIHTGDWRAISPVFTSLQYLYAWMRENGYVTRYDLDLFGVEQLEGVQGGR